MSNPPGSHTESSEALESRRNLKRPASHKWAIGILLATALLSGSNMLDLDPFDPDRFLFGVNAVCSIFPVVYLVILRFSRVTYYATAACLLMLIIQFTFFLFYGSEDELLLLIFFVPTFLCFTFGGPSRVYFGIIKPLLEPVSIVPRDSADEEPPGKYLDY